MRRTIVALLTALAILFSTASAAAPAAAPKSAPRATAHFKFRGSSGFSARVETIGQTIDLVVSGHHQLVVYSVKGSVSAHGLKARFGNLGRISVEFVPTGRRGDLKPRECRGNPETVKIGTFVGTIQFKGERDYVSIDATRARGCIRLHSAARGRVDRTPATSAAEEGEREVATLTADRERRFFRVAGFREPDGSGEAFFAGGVLEHRGAMRIGRAALVSAPASAFVFDHVLGTATVTPPPPFSGSANFERRGPDGSKAWTGTLTVALLGVDPVGLTGPGFTLGLFPEFDN